MKSLVAILITCLFGSSLYAASGPYPVDLDTLHLWHFDAQVDGVVLDMAVSNQKDLILGNGLTLADSLDGFGKAINTYDGDAVNQVYAGDDQNGVLISELSGADGAFTFEAVVKPMVAQNSIPHHMEIISLEDDDANPERGFQFRINDNGQLRFQTIAGIIVSFDAAISFNADSWYHVAVAYNGQENTADNLKLYWTEIGTATSAQEVGSYQLAEDLKSDVSSFFCVGNELRTTGNGYTENFEGLVDEVRISSVARDAGDMILKASLPWAVNPVPAAAEKLSTLDAISELQWDTGDAANVTSFYLYFWKDEPNYPTASPIEITDITDPITAALPETLVSDSLYFWRVDQSVNNSAPADAATITGPVWVFETPPSIPVIINNPVSLRVLASEPAVELACEFSSLSEPTVQWFKVGSETPLAATGDISISMAQDGYTYTSTLQISTPVISDEGEYYCEITNIAGTVSTGNAYLIIKRLLAQYDFEGDLAPTAGEADVPTGLGKSMAGLDEPNEPDAVNVALSYETGYNGVGQAVVVATDEYIDFSTEGYPKAGLVNGGYGLGLDAGTFVCWVKPVAGLAEGVLYQNFNDGYSAGFNLLITDNPDVRMFIRNDNNTTFINLSGASDRPGWDIYDGQWHMVAYTWEIGQSSTIYVDGQPVVTGTASTNTVFAEWQRGLLLGASRETANRQFLKPQFATSVDALRIYNYRLDEQAKDVFAQEYMDATGIVPCLEINFEGVQFNYDNTGTSYCQVDLADFAAFAASWMEGGLFDGQ